MPIYWDPKLLLQVTPAKGHTCTGTTKKGVRCQNSVNKIDRAVASRILEDLSEENIMAEGLTDRVSRWIRELAELTLCKAVHRKSQVQDVVHRWTLAIMNYIEVEEELRGTEVHDPPPVAAPRHAQLPFRQPQPAPVWRAASHPPRGVEARAEHLPDLRVGEARALRDRAPAQRQNPPPRERNMRQEPPVDGGAWIRLRAENRYSPADPENDRPMPLVPHFQTYPEADIPVAAIPVREPRVRRALVSPRLEAQIEMVPRLSHPVVFPRPEAQIEREPRLSRPIVFPQPEAQVEREPLVRQPFVPPRPEVPRPLPHPEPNNPHLHPTPNNRIRKPLQGGCYVCYEDFENPQDAVWCRVCGQNLHVDCFRAWTAGKRFEDVTCAFCRALWFE